MKGLVSLGGYGFIIDNSKRDYTNSKRMFARKSVAKALMKAKSFLPKGYNFKIWSGKRSLAEQRKIIQICAKDFKKRNPENWKKMLIDFTGGYDSRFVLSLAYKRQKEKSNINTFFFGPPSSREAKIVEANCQNLSIKYNNYEIIKSGNQCTFTDILYYYFVYIWDNIFHKK